MNEVSFGAGRDGACAALGGSAFISSHDVREYYISKDLVLTAQASLETDVPRFALQSSDLDLELPSSSVLPSSTASRILDSDLSRFQLQWCLESAINNDVIHNFSQGLYSVTYISSKFALPKSRVVEMVGLGLTQAANEFTLSQWQTASSFCLEVIRYSNAQCAFLVSDFGSPSFPQCPSISTYFQVCSRLNCLSGVKVLIEGVVKVETGQSVALTIAVFLANLMSGHRYMSSLPLLALTCSTNELSADLLILLSSFGVIPISALLFSTSCCPTYLLRVLVHGTLYLIFASYLTH